MTLTVNILEGHLTAVSLRFSQIIDFDIGMASIDGTFTHLFMAGSLVIAGQRLS